MKQPAIKDLIIFLNQQIVEETDPEKKARFVEIAEWLMVLQQYMASTTAHF